MRLAWLLGTLVVALVIAVLAAQTPRPLPETAAQTQFSATRAMVDVRQIARAPHPTGSAEHARVQDYLTRRLRALDLTVEVQAGPLPAASAQRLERIGGDAAAGTQAGLRNLIGVLPGMDSSLPAVLLMAHYDSAPRSPGAADDAAGVAAILEAVRAIQVRDTQAGAAQHGVRQRDIIILFTDAEEVQLDGARLFFEQHPLAKRVGAVINLEARGGGGRAFMFETGPGNAQMIDVFGPAASRATGGVSSTSLAVFIYERMPNGSDFTLARERDLPGVNLAFIGRPGQYHTLRSTPDALDQGSLQHIGSQTLETADALVHAPLLPQRTANAVYTDLFGRLIVSWPPVVGWGLLVLASLLTGYAALQARRRAGLNLADVGRGVLDMLWFLAVAIVLTQAVRLAAGPMLAQAAKPDAYYDLMARLPALQAAAAMVVLAVGLVLQAWRRSLDGRIVAGIIALAAVITTIMAGPSPLIIGAAVVAIGLSLWRLSVAWSPWGGWLGVLVLVLLLGFAAQGAAPDAAVPFILVALVASLSAAVAAALDPTLSRKRALGPIAVIGAIGAAWVMTLAHPTFLGVGMEMPLVLGVFGLLVLAFVRPLAIDRPYARPAQYASASLLLGALVVSAASGILGN